MAEIRVDTGLVTHTINGVCELTFNPTDASFIERLYNATEFLDKKQAEYKEKSEKTDDLKEMFDVLRAIDHDMRQELDNVLKAGFCEAVFADMNVYAFAGGMPVWANLIEAILEYCNTELSNETKKCKARIDKYIKKYKK